MKSVFLLRVGSSNRHGVFLFIDDTSEQILSIVFMDPTHVLGKLIDKIEIYQWHNLKNKNGKIFFKYINVK